MTDREVKCRLQLTQQKRGGEELPHVQGPGGSRECQAAMAQEQPRGANPCSRSGGEASEEMHLVQGKEQWLHFAGAAVKRYPTFKVRETQVRW